MKTAKLPEINWQNRFDSLPPTALIAFDGAAKKLSEKLLSLDDAKLSELQGVFGENLIFATGKTESLPWVDGVIYLGKDKNAPSVFLPTNLCPSIPIDLFEKSLLKTFAAQKPFAVVNSLIIPIGEMRPISRNILKSRGQCKRETF